MVVRLRQVHVPKDRADAGGSRARAQQGAQELDRAVVSGERIAVRLPDKKHITVTSE